MATNTPTLGDLMQLQRDSHQKTESQLNQILGKQDEMCATLGELGKEQTSMKVDMTSQNTELSTKMENIEGRTRDQEDRIRKLETEGTKLTTKSAMIGAILIIVLTALVGWIFASVNKKPDVIYQPPANKITQTQKVVRNSKMAQGVPAVDYLHEHKMGICVQIDADGDFKYNYPQLHAELAPECKTLLTDSEKEEVAALTFEELDAGVEAPIHVASN